jgi:hypothetical protein
VIDELDQSYSEDIRGLHGISKQVPRVVGAVKPFEDLSVPWHLRVAACLCADHQVHVDKLDKPHPRLPPPGNATWSPLHPPPSGLSVVQVDTLVDVKTAGSAGFTSNKTFTADE